MMLFFRLTPPEEIPARELKLEAYREIQLGSFRVQYQIALVFSFLLQRQQQHSRNKDVFLFRGAERAKRVKKKVKKKVLVEICAI